MIEATGRPMHPIPTDAHLLRPVAERAERDPDRPIAAYRDGARFVDVTAAELYRRVRALAKGLMVCGVGPGSRVGLMSHTRLEWVVLDYAILAAGAVTVPIYETSSAEQVEWIVRDSGAELLVVETPAMRDLYEIGTPRVPTCPEVFVIDDGGLDDLVRRGEAVDDRALDDRVAAITTDAPATIIYTSGTTGRPKGCVLTHGNLWTNVEQTLDAIEPMLRSDEVCLLFLPLAHSLTKIISLVAAEFGVKVAYASELAALPEELKMVRPTMVIAVPRIFEKVFNGARQKAGREGHGAVFHKASDVAVDWSRGGGAHGLHLLTGVEHSVFEQLVYKKVRDVFGGRLRFAFSGGGPLGEHLTHFFNGVGVKVLEGYGLTETSPTLTVNRAGAWKPGTVGQPLIGTTISIAPDGEILAKGPQVFAGYWHNDGATDEIFDANGWFKTGDIGELDEEGYLRITGRKKELIVTAAGKNVAPAPLEDRLRAHPLVSQAIVVGDGRPFIAAMITIDEEALEGWITDQKLAAESVADVLDTPVLRAEVQAAVDDANTAVSRAESIRKFAILPHDLTLADGELTPTLKVRRTVVEKSYAHVIDELYRG